jgi:DNA-binding transcriptional ArsR family regulator
MSSDASISTLRFALRVANGFIVDLLTIFRQERDFTDALILASVVQSNSAPFAGDRVLQQNYAALDSPPPLDIRRPISINAIAASLGLPFETVRRRAKRLVAEGVCEAAPDGLRLCDATLISPGHRRAVEDTYATVRSLYGRLKRAGCLEIMGLPPNQVVSWPAAAPPVRIVWRSASDYVLRMMEHLLPNFPSLSRAFIVLAVVKSNTDGLPDSIRGAEGLEPGAFVADSYRRPARASDIAALLGLPHETVRRHLAALVEDGRCIRVKDGVVVPAVVLARQNVLNAWAANFRDLTRLFSELADLGVLALWDAELEREQSAA